MITVFLLIFKSAANAVPCSVGHGSNTVVQQSKKVVGSWVLVSARVFSQYSHIFKGVHMRHLAVVGFCQPVIKWLHAQNVSLPLPKDKECSTISHKKWKGFAHCSAFKCNVYRWKNTILFYKFLSWYFCLCYWKYFHCSVAYFHLLAYLCCIQTHMCVISWYFPALFPCLCGKFIFMTSQNPVTITKCSPPLNSGSKGGDERPCRGSPGDPLLTNSLPDCDPAVTFIWKKSELERKKLVALLACDSSVHVIRPREPCRSQDQLLCFVRSCFHCKTNNTTFLKPGSSFIPLNQILFYWNHNKTSITLWIRLENAIACICHGVSVEKELKLNFLRCNRL